MSPEELLSPLDTSSSTEEMLAQQMLANHKTMAKFETGGLRDNKGKFPISCVHKSVPAAIAEVTHKSSIPGGGKYPMWNYKKGLPQTGVADSGLRHLFAWLSGEDSDKESGIHHLKHALWNIALMVEQLETHPELDDRYKAEGEQK